MMATTHAVVSVALAVLALPFFSEFVAAPLVVVAAFLGGLAPDADLLWAHRKTLHYPVGFSALALGLASLAVLVPSQPLILVTVVVASAAIHALSDVCGGSPEPEPWNPTVDVAVYNHALGQWHRARRWVRYSGAPEDFLLGAAFGGVAIAAPATSGTVDIALSATLVFSALFTLTRKRLDAVPALAISLVPRRLRLLVPRFRLEEREQGGTTVAVRFEK